MLRPLSLPRGSGFASSAPRSRIVILLYVAESAGDANRTVLHNISRYIVHRGYRVKLSNFACPEAFFPPSQTGANPRLRTSRGPAYHVSSLTTTTNDPLWCLAKLAHESHPLPRRNLNLSNTLHWNASSPTAARSLPPLRRVTDSERLPCFSAGCAYTKAIEGLREVTAAVARKANSLTHSPGRRHQRRTGA